MGMSEERRRIRTKKKAAKEARMKGVKPKSDSKYALKKRGQFPLGSPYNVGGPKESLLPEHQPARRLAGEEGDESRLRREVEGNRFGRLKEINDALADALLEIYNPRTWGVRLTPTLIEKADGALRAAGRLPKGE